MEWLLMPEAPGATVVITLIAFSISFVNSSINRIVISRTIGWNRYKAMRKEISEFQAQTRQALRSKDEKLIEKLRKKEKQNLQMQKKMAKPQFIMFGLSFFYIFVWWFFLIPLYGGASVVAYIPGIGGVSVLWWYLLCSLLFGIVSSRLLGIMGGEH